MKSLRMVAAAAALLVMTACGGTEAGSPTAATTTSTSKSISSSSSSSSSSASPTSSSSSSSSTPSSSSSSSSSSPSGGTDVDPVAAELVSKLIAGYATTTSLSGQLFIDGAGMSGDAPLGTFDQEVADGAVTAMKMNIAIPQAGEFELIIVDDRFFLGGEFVAQYGNKYVEVSDTTTDPTLAQLYTTLSDSVNSASISQYVTFLQLATQTENAGTETVDGVDAEKYTMVLDLSRLDTADVDASTKQSMEALVAAGVTELPCTFWIDGAGHLLQVVQDVAVSGQSIQTKVTFSGFDTPVDITAPDPSLVVVAP